MKILVNKCPDTGTLFEDDILYKKHRSQLSKEKCKKRKEQTQKETFTTWLAAEKLKITDPEQICDWVLNNQRELMEWYNTLYKISGSRYISSYDGKFYPEDNFSQLLITGLRFSYSVSNTHECPDNGVTNWGGYKKDAPRGYPGWGGRIDGKLDRPKIGQGRYPVSSLLNMVGIKTGTGGGGNASWGYSISIFLADWPGLQVWVDIMEEDRIIQRLKNGIVR